MIALGTEYYSYTAIKNRIKNKEVDDKENELLNLINKLTILLTNALESSNDFSVSAYNLFDEVFELRIEGINWLLNEKQPYFNKAVENSTDEIIFNVENIARQIIRKNDSHSSKDKSINPIEVLLPNIAFAKRTLKKVIVGYLESEEGKQFLEGKNNISIDSYNGYINIIKGSVSSQTQRNVQMLAGTSLMLETCLIAVDILIDNYNTIKLPENRFNELNELIINNAQQYGATARNIGLIGNKKKPAIDSPNLTEEELKQEKKLAEMGMSNYLENLNNE